jgi:lysine 6-dehydrogenase
MNIVVLGAGRVGSAVARDLARSGHDVTVADRSAKVLAPLASTGVRVHTADARDPHALAPLLDEAELVVSAVPGALGFQVLRSVLEAGRSAVDVSFFPEDPYELDALAKARGVTAVVDAGAAPGLGNLVLGYLESTLAATESFHCSVGGLPVERAAPWEYKAPVSPSDVIQEYVRPVRLRRGGQSFILSALDELQRVNLPSVGELESFLTDGLRTLLRTSGTPTLVERTLRYPGYVERVRLLRESGFFSTAPVDVGGVVVRPVDVAVRVLSDAWKLHPGEEDLTVMRVEVVGADQRGRVRHVYDLFDRYDVETNTSSMARTTGYTCTALVEWLASGHPARPGIVPPEVLATEEGCLDFVLAHLAARGVRLSHSEERLPAVG